MNKSLKVIALAGLLSLNFGCVPTLYNYYVRQNEQFQKEGYPLDGKSLELAEKYYTKAQNKRREIGVIKTYHKLESGIFTLYPDLKSLTLTIENINDVDYETLAAYLDNSCKGYSSCYSYKSNKNNLELRISDYSTDFQKKWGVANDTVNVQKESNKIIINASKIIKSNFGLKGLTDDIKSTLNIPLSKEAEQIYNELK